MVKKSKVLKIRKYNNKLKKGKTRKDLAMSHSVKYGKNYLLLSKFLLLLL